MSDQSDQSTFDIIVEDGALLEIRPAPHRRDWMDKTPDQYAYRCLPLAIANGHGWEVLAPMDLTAIWHGGRGLEAIDVTSADPRVGHVATSHFGDGILTMHVPGLFRTPAGWDLYVTGPINHVKDAIQPLTGVIETDWSPYSFTMNWKFTRAKTTVEFRKGEPIAALFPIRRGAVDAFTPVLKRPDQAADVWADHMAWRDSRNNFNADLKRGDAAAVKQKWQKAYMQGPDETLDPPHRTKLRLAPPRDDR